MDRQDLQADLRNIGVALGLAVSVTYDPTADASERWVASVGLDAMGAGGTPGLALGIALGELVNETLAQKRAG